MDRGPPRSQGHHWSQGEGRRAVGRAEYDEAAADLAARREGWEAGNAAYEI